MRTINERRVFNAVVEDESWFYAVSSESLEAAAGSQRIRTSG